MYKSRGKATPPSTDRKPNQMITKKDLRFSSMAPAWNSSIGTSSLKNYTIIHTRFVYFTPRYLLILSLVSQRTRQQKTDTDQNRRRKNNSQLLDPGKTAKTHHPRMARFGRERRRSVWHKNRYKTFERIFIHNL